MYFRIPEITLPDRGQFKSTYNTPDVSYNEAFLPRIRKYTCIPSFRRLGVDTSPHVPSFQQKLEDLRISIQVLDQSQIDCMGIINGRVLMGGEKF